MRILVVLNGSIQGYSGGDLHSVAVVNEWSQHHRVEVFLPPGSSKDLGDLLRAEVICRRPAAHRGRVSRGRYLALLLIRMLYASWFLLRRRTNWDVVVASAHYPF